MVSLSTNNDTEPIHRKNAQLLGLDPNSITDTNGDRTTIPALGKNDLIIRPIKNHDFQKIEHGAGYSR